MECLCQSKFHATIKTHLAIHVFLIRKNMTFYVCKTLVWPSTPRGSVSVGNTLRRTCSYNAIGLLLKVMALQKLASLLTVFWARSMTIREPLAFGWKSSGLMGRLPHWMGRHLLGLWWHRCDVDGNGAPMESEARGKKKKHTQNKQGAGG